MFFLDDLQCALSHEKMVPDKNTLAAKTSLRVALGKSASCRPTFVVYASRKDSGEPVHACTGSPESLLLTSGIRCRHVRLMEQGCD